MTSIMVERDKVKNHTIHQILSRYWGFSSFRPFQEEIIHSVLNGNDTLALLPTGGGKSICYQVPAMAREGLCLVVSPLVALMKDQVDDLKKKGIKALYVFSGMKPAEIDIALDNAIYGGYKFLFVSPERLGTDLFLARAPRLHINLIAVDEAHCISQWGYDFRPPYLKIAEIRVLFPGTPVLALTATATPRVKEDILSKLEFRKSAKVFLQSFDRPNIIYSVLDEENKNGRLLKLLNMVDGSAIVYAGFRRSCRELAVFLQQNGISADFYHAGLTFDERNIRQEAWKAGNLRVMVCTNAFGMGIDKADVRLVVHVQMPGSLEAYYQETGRAGRDSQRSFAISFVNSHDKELLGKGSLKHLDIKYLKRVYQALGNYFQIPEESGNGQSFDFDISDFAKRYEFPAAEAYKALKEIENAGYISLSDAVFMPSRLRIIVDQSQLYAYQVAHKEYDLILKAILRSHGGCFEDYVPINEKKLAGMAGKGTLQVMEWLRNLGNSGIIDYLPQKTAPQLSFLLARVSAGELSFGFTGLAERRLSEIEKTEAVIKYVSVSDTCRGRILLSYFGEAMTKDCGHCDFCINKKEKIGTEDYRSRVIEHLKYQIVSGNQSIASILSLNMDIDEKEMIATIRWMLDRQIIRLNAEDILEIIA